MAGAALNDGTGALAASGAWFRAGYLGSSLALTPALADVDDDGALDLAVGGPMSITTWHGNGDGTFGTAKTSTLVDAREVEFVTPADIDDDSLVDLVAFQRPGDAREDLVAYGDGAGNVDEYHELRTGTSLGGDGTPARQIAVADIDGDDDQDVLVLAGSLGVVEHNTGGARRRTDVPGRALRQSLPASMEEPQLVAGGLV